MDEENVVYVYTVKYFSAIKKEGNPAIWANMMKLEGIMLGKIPDRERQIL